MLGSGAHILQISCKYHPKAILLEDYHAGDMVCSECGLVVNERVIEVSSEWRTFQDGSSSGSCRVGAAENAIYGDNDLTTNIVDFARSLGNEAPKMKVRKSNEEKFVNMTVAQMREICSRMNIGNTIMEDAMRLFKDVRDKQFLRGKDKKLVMAACIFIECQRNKVLRTFQEFVGGMGVPRKLLARVVTAIIKKFEVNMDHGCSSSEQDIVSRFCAKLKFDVKEERKIRYQTEIKALEMAEKINKAGFLGGTSPLTIASITIYLAAQALGFTKTMKEIGDITGTSEQTFKKCLKTMQDHIKEIS